jgi:SLT domain-containing protein
MPGGPNDRWTSTIIQALRLVGLPTTPAYVSRWDRQIDTESGGNPRAVQQIHDINSILGRRALGLVQVIPPTFDAYSLPGMNDIFNPLHNLAAGMNYAKNRYGITGMLNAIGQGRGYEHGTDWALPGWAWVGESGPELVKFRGGEQVMSNRDSMAAVGGGQVQLSKESVDAIADKLSKAIHERPQVVIDGPSVTSESKMAYEIAREFRRENMRLERYF